MEEKGCRLMKMLRRCMCKKTLLWSPSKFGYCTLKKWRRERTKEKEGANGDVAAMMEKYLEIRTKQVEDERNKPRVVDEYSIKTALIC